MDKNTYPDCYLHVQECRSGETWIMPIHPRANLNLHRLCAKWVKDTFVGELKMDGELQRPEGDYYARIMTDGRPPDSVVCWSAGGFYCKSTY
jgi:hypothetical protein